MHLSAFFKGSFLVLLVLNFQFLSILHCGPHSFHGLLEVTLVLVQKGTENMCVSDCFCAFDFLKDITGVFKSLLLRLQLTDLIFRVYSAPKHKNFLKILWGVSYYHQGESSSRLSCGNIS